MKQVLFAVACFIAIGSATPLQVVFQLPQITWSSPEVLISQGDTNWIQPSKLCQTLITQNASFRNPQCHNASDWQLDPAFAKYRRWMNLNFEIGTLPSALQTRDPLVAQRLRDLDDRKLLLMSHRNDTLWIALYSGPRSSLGANSSRAPLAIAYMVAPFIDIEKRLVMTWFKATPQRKLNADEKNELKVKPLKVYQENPPTDLWVALGMGRTQAHVPLTPNSWTQSKTNSTLRNYRITADSLSLWNFLEDESELQTLRAGFLWNGFIGAEVFINHSSHAMKTNPTDTIYQNMDHWTFDRLEAGLTGVISTRRNLGPQLAWYPHLVLGFHYSFLIEDIALSSGSTPSHSYNNRIEFLPFYKGAIMAAGARIVWKDLLGLEMRAGLNNRGRSLDREPSLDASAEPTILDASAEPTIIGGATLDAFLSASIEYHWQPFESK